MAGTTFRASYTSADHELVARTLETNTGNVKRTAQETGIPETTVRRWKKVPPTVRDRNESGATTHDRAALRRAHGQLNRKIVRKLGTTGGNVAATARALGVSRDRVKRLRDETVRGFGDRRETRRPKGSRRGQRARVLRELGSNGENVKATVRATGLPEATVRRWKSERRSVRETVSESAFYESTRRDERTACLLWTGQVNPGGYGVTALGGKPRLAHRVAYELRYPGALETTQHLHHVCRNTSCVNTAHLLPIANAGERGHTALHRLEDAFLAAVESGELARELAALQREPVIWPDWLNHRALGSLLAEESAAVGEGSQNPAQ
jgi:transposase-like protein